MIITLKGANFSGTGNNIGNLSQIGGTFTFTINPTPSDAIVKINGTARKSITGAYGTAISWEVSKDGYNTRTGSLTMPLGGKTMSVSLTAVGSVTPPVTPPVDPEEPGTGGGSGETPSVPTIYRTNKALGIQMLEFGDLKFQSNTTTQSPAYSCQVVAADVSNYVGKTISISTTHAYIKNNSTYGDAYYCFFLNAAPNNKTPEMLPSVTKLSDLGTTSGNSNMDVILDKDIIVEKFDVVTTSDKYTTKSVTVPAGAKYIYFTHTRKGGADKEANIVFN